MVVQWLAKTTGKSVIKHKQVQCQLTIVSSRKLPVRDAINLVYRALALEGFTAIETSKSVLILPEGQDPKLAAEVVDNGSTPLPEGRQRLVKIFQLKNVSPAELRDKVKPVLSDKATVEIAERAQQLIITDFTDNIRLVGELIRELDVAASGDTVIEFFTLKHSEAEELGTLLTLVLNAQPAPPSSPSSSSSSRSSSSSSSRLPPGVVMSESAPPSSAPPPGSSSSSSGSSGSSASAQPVRVWPDKVSNRLIIAAQKSKMPEVKRLIDLLDTEKPRDVAIRVIQLKHVSAEDLVRDLGPLYQKLSGKSVKDMIEVSYNSRANSLIVLSGEANFKLIESLVE